MPSLVASVFADVAGRRAALQIAAAAAVVALAYFFVANVSYNLTRLKIASGFEFLFQAGGYTVSEAFLPHTSRSPMGWLFIVGLLNTLYISALAIVLATLLGVLLGVARVSSNWLVAKVSASYIELFRNIPMLLQIAFWYALVRQLPLPSQAFHPLPHVFISNRGLVHPRLVFDAATGLPTALFLAGLLAAALYWLWARRRNSLTGGRLPVLLPALALAAAPMATAMLTELVAIRWDLPMMQGFNFRGGALHSPEFFALLLGLVTYIAAFIGEIVRSGIQSVGIGQREAAQSLGIRRRVIMRYVILPQAMQVIVPALTSQYLSLVKNSSLAVWIGYPDLVSVANAAIGQAGQALECILIMVAVYLTISLSISVLMNWYNRRVALKGTS